jgi:hypothetical protein
MCDFIEQLKCEAIENNYQIVYDKADDRKEKVIDFLGKRRLAVKVYAPGNNLFSHAFSIDKQSETFILYIRFDKSFYTCVAYKNAGKTSRYFDDEDLINKNLGAVFLYLECLGFKRVVAKEMMVVDLGEGPLATGFTSSALFNVLIEDQ